MSRYSTKPFFRSSASFINLFLSIIFSFSTYTSGAQTLINPAAEGGFELGAGFAANGWTAVNDAENKWYVGATAKCTGVNAVYIDANTTAGAGNTYVKTAARVSHFYRDVAFPACQSNINLVFKYKGGGQIANNGSFKDYLAVFVVPIGTTPVAGSQLPVASKVGAAGYCNQASCTQVSIALPAAFSGTTQRLVFSWINDATGGTDPGISLDDISITAAPPVIVNDEPCGATAVTVGSVCNFVQYSNAGATPSGGLPIPSCSVYNGGDVWFTTTVPASGQLIIDANTGVITDGAMAVYTGPNASNLTEVACDDDASVNGLMPYLNLTTLLPGTQVWVRFWEYGGDNNGTFSLCFYAPACPGGTPANDLCINAVPVTLGTTITGTTACASGTGEPTAASCWLLPGTLNTVWYSVVAPASGKISVRTGLGTLTNTQIAVYSGTCAALTQIGCGNDVSLCGNTQLWSEVVLTGLVPNQVYFIRVDGYNNLSGDFTLTAIDGNNPWPPVYGQDCGTTFSVCSPNLTVGNPGFIGSGNNCDFNPGTGCPSTCLQVGERNSVWYSFTASAAGVLQFTLTPNTIVDFDFALWDVTGLANPCASISANSITPLRCSYASPSGNGATGLLTGSGDNCEGALGNGFVESVNVVAGQTFMLLISNFSTVAFTGYNLNFGASPINYAAGSSLAWTGGTDTDWIKTGNWGGCATPDCQKDVVIYGGPTNQPYIAAGLTMNCRNITIQPGASLTLAAGAVLEVCGNFTNFGVLNAAPGSIIRFANGNVNQSVNGTLVSPNAIGTLEVSKTGGVFSFNTNTDILGDFKVLTSASVVNANSFNHRLAGDFLNNGSYNAGASTLRFIGTASQNYFNVYGGGFFLNKVVMEHGGSGVNLSSNMNIGSLGSLTLTTGKIITTPVFEVNVTNPSSVSVTPGNASSYVEGFLRRSINSTGSYDFPVGEATKGYQRMNINYTANTTVENLRVDFRPYSALPIALGVIDCGIVYNVSSLNNGFWNVVPSGGVATSGLFDMTLFNTAYTNPAAAWTIHSNISNAGWTLANGACAPSTAPAVKRTGMSNPAGWFGSAQGGSALPVNWLNFDAIPDGNRIRLKWSTAQEDNCMGFEIMRLSPAVSSGFETIGWQTGSGTSSSINSYGFDDYNVNTGNEYYYKLKQIDYDGRFDFSDVAYAKLEDFRSHSLSVFPNPLTDVSVLAGFSSGESVTLTIINALGQSVCSRDIDKIQDGDFMLRFNDMCQSLVAGVYSVRLSSSSGVQQCKFVVSGGR